MANKTFRKHPERVPAGSRTCQIRNTELASQVLGIIITPTGDYLQFDDRNKRAIFL